MTFMFSVALISSLFYILLRYNQYVYDVLITNTLKVDIPIMWVISSWVTAGITPNFGVVSVLVFILLFSTLTGFMYLLLYYRKKNNPDSIKSPFAEITDVDAYFSNREGVINYHVSDNYYLGVIVMDEKPQEILIYNENGFNEGDKFYIKCISGSKIIGEKLENKPIDKEAEEVVNTENNG